MISESSLVILSGGQDSTTCLFWARERYSSVYAITFDYEQRHKIEIEAARKVASICGVVYHEVIPLGSVLKGTSPLTNREMEVGQYESVASMPGGVENTFVPSRNSLFLSIAMNRAFVLDCKYIVLGLSQVDYGGYPDCRVKYLTCMTKSLNEGIFGGDEEKWIQIIAPLIFLSKKEAVELAKNLPGCLEALKFSHTCYKGEYPPCMKCHSCLLRQRGFEEAGVKDPLLSSRERMESENI